MPGEESTEPSPTPTEHYPFTPSSGPVQTPDDVGPEETSEVVPGDSATPTPTPTISPSDDSNATMLHEVRAGVRLFGYVATSFDSEERGFFRRGMSTFLGIAPKQITINHVEDVNTRSTRRLLQASAVDVYYVVSTTTPQVASAVVDETNRALNTTGSGALLSSLQSAGLVISQVVIISRPNVTVHMDESNLSPPANATGRSTTNDPGTNASPTPTPTPGYPTPTPTPTPGYPTPTPAYPAPTPDCVPLGTETEESQYERAGSLQHEALQQARDFARDNDLPMPNASTFVRAKVCNAPHMRCCAELGWRQDNRVRFPFVCGNAAACARDTFQQAQENCKARGGDLCRGNAVSTSMDDPSCPGSKTDYVWTLTKCDVNGVAGRVIRPSAGGAPGPLCETNTLALHQSRCCSNVC